MESPDDTIPLQIIDERVTKGMERDGDMIRYSWNFYDGKLECHYVHRVLFKDLSNVDEYAENKAADALNEKLRKHGLPLIETEERERINNVPIKCRRCIPEMEMNPLPLLDSVIHNVLIDREQFPDGEWVKGGQGFNNDLR